MRIQVIPMLAFLMLALSFMSNANGQADPPKKNKLSVKEIQALLTQKSSTKNLQEKVKLRIALEYITDMSGNQLIFYIDRDGFAAENGAAKAPAIWDEEVSLPANPKQLATGQMLTQFLSQVARGKAAYVVRQGYIEITTKDKAKAAAAKEKGKGA